MFLDLIFILFLWFQSKCSIFYILKPKSDTILFFFVYKKIFEQKVKFLNMIKNCLNNFSVINNFMKTFIGDIIIILFSYFLLYLLTSYN